MKREMIHSKSMRRSIAAMLVLAATGCSVVPDWSRRESREVDVTVHYAPDTESRAVRIPSSTTDVLILQLDSGPEELRETYSGLQRHLVVPAGETGATVRCRYRLFRRHAPDGTPLPWTRPSELFPGAQRIVDRSTDTSGQN